MSLYSAKMNAKGMINVPVNMAVSGLTSANLLTGLKTLSFTDPAIFNTLHNADIITLNIGGNDVLGPMINIFNQLLMDMGITDITKATPAQLAQIAAFSPDAAQMAAIQAGAQSFVDSFPQIITFLKTNAPDAKIQVSTIYNPFPDNLGLYQGANALITAMNEGIWAGSAGGAVYTVADVYNAFAESTVPVTNFNLAAGSVDIHPNADGHVLIADIHIDGYTRVSYDLALKATVGGTATLMPGGGTNGQYYGNDIVAIIATPDSGYIFSGWTVTRGAVANAQSVVTGFQMPFGNATVTANFVKEVFTVMFVNYDGSQLKTEVVEHGSDATAPAAPTRSGHTFIGWDKAFNNITSDLTVTAMYKINNYTVKFDSNGGSLVAEQTVNYGFMAQEPTDNPTKKGYDFAGWYEEGFNDVFDFLNTPITKDITLKAKWVLRYDIIITGTSPGNGQSDVYFAIASANGKGYTVMISDSADGIFTQYNNVNYNSKGAHIKGLTNGKTYWVYIVYNAGNGNVLRSEAVMITPKK